MAGARGRPEPRRGAASRAPAGVYWFRCDNIGTASIVMRRTLLLACLACLGACATRPTATLRHPAPPPGEVAPPVTAAILEPTAGDSATTVEASALDAFPTRVFTSDAIVSVHSPELLTGDDPARPRLRTAVDVYIDADGRSCRGSALMPASVIAIDRQPALLARGHDP